MQPLILHAVRESKSPSQGLRISKLTSIVTGPNSWKVAIILEELAVPYKITFHSMKEIKETLFTDLNPNGRVPGQ